jgi:hypothetical protein
MVDLEFGGDDRVDGELLFQRQARDISQSYVEIKNSKNPRLMSRARVGERSNISSTLNETK